ncbi:MAG TPA: YchJ family protein [Polyangiaceae bacterium]|nr:MAG: hypothetical protein BWY17_02802 [Deltaproteobacteria bacterium ADurb.Bin207]HNS95803.1 YchJ family protein [Polyangiaceae bacterium]HNZ24632.1 YchJ family protein [Polyangiaceae bacterium]HOD23236.1 YchJ family protein [Polyangiaceae bacterium]HOE51728.1 YchJ family protein [Polyangiaceae bacterium]
MSCPCGRGPSLSECCGPYLKGIKKPITAEDLMRSRYAAYVVQDIDYIIKTHAPETVHTVDREDATAWSQNADWLGLDVLRTERGEKDDEEGIVEFVARYELDGDLHTHHERSRFRRIDGTWFYVEGEMVKPEPMVRTGPKVGRNDPCPCGSGKKYKKCCGKVA